MTSRNLETLLRTCIREHLLRALHEDALDRATRTVDDFFGGKSDTKAGTKTGTAGTEPAGPPGDKDKEEVDKDKPNLGKQVKGDPAVDRIADKISKFPAIKADMKKIQQPKDLAKFIQATAQVGAGSLKDPLPPKIKSAVEKVSSAVRQIKPPQSGEEEKK
jgi:hypothetical protein